MLSKNAQKLLNGWIAAAGPVVQKLYGKSEDSWTDIRKHYMQGLEEIFPAIEGISYNTTTLGNVPTMISEIQGHAGSRVALYIHGGGYVHGGVEAYRGLTGRIATVMVPTY